MMDDRPTEFSSRRASRFHTPGDKKLNIRHERVGNAPLGSGSFGTVYKCLDLNSGTYMALKVLRRSEEQSAESWRDYLNRTVKKEVKLFFHSIT
jgi:hypothetical protein